jgi:hypothetical protein
MVLIGFLLARKRNSILKVREGPPDRPSSSQKRSPSLNRRLHNFICENGKYIFQTPSIIFCGPLCIRGSRGRKTWKRVAIRPGPLDAFTDSRIVAYCGHSNAAHAVYQFCSHYQLIILGSICLFKYCRPLHLVWCRKSQGAHTFCCPGTKVYGRWIHWPNKSELIRNMWLRPSTVPP